MINILAQYATDNYDELLLEAKTQLASRKLLNYCSPADIVHGATIGLIENAKLRNDNIPALFVLAITRDVINLAEKKRPILFSDMKNDNGYELADIRKPGYSDRIYMIPEDRQNNYGKVLGAYHTVMRITKGL